ncbi:hypothetical protein Sulac_3093 [Sulfobacillus acidophilus DSM 10332]|uniref:Uncharacterized protein n=1 Tax=Sulfobacillus acidophilus (strain ATCC 700253 / DSM 10332 / NAL) TaxID=679936 RepID=G8TYR1_SULAD|nr:hypothetical protein Sulac_0475 [Sulfobacillus acidophilus DSM 10332]AEW06545.1 hypothetical protein Sulac_3093 [Sulfobacillus acidophilus DSM 10332]
MAEQSQTLAAVTAAVLRYLQKLGYSESRSPA